MPTLVDHRDKIIAKVREMRAKHVPWDDIAIKIADDGFRGTNGQVLSGKNLQLYIWRDDERQARDLGVKKLRPRSPPLSDMRRPVNAETKNEVAVDTETARKLRMVSKILQSDAPDEEKVLIIKGILGG